MGGVAESRRHLSPFRSYFTSGLMAAILDFGSRRRRTVFAVRGRSLAWSTKLDSHWNRGAITCRSKLFPLPVWLSAILNFGSLPSSTNVGQRRQTSVAPQCQTKIMRDRNAGQPLGSRWKEQPFKVISSPVWWRHLESGVNNVGGYRQRQRHDQVDRGRKCGG